MAEPSANDMPADSSPQTGWTRICPACQAKVQPVARGCWRCGALISEPDTEHPDYRPPLVDPEAVNGVSISILIGMLFLLPVVLVVWAVATMLNW
jgi:hypothetical protein